MVINLSDPLQWRLFMMFVLTWGLGLAVRLIFNPAKLSSDVPSIPAYRQIRVIGPLRWLFGYMPVTGPVSTSGAIFQLAAFMTVGIIIVLASIWPGIFRALYWSPLVVVLGVTILLAFRFLMWLWDKQQRKS